MKYQIENYKYNSKEELDKAIYDKVIKKWESNNWAERLAKGYFLLLDDTIKRNYIDKKPKNIIKARKATEESLVECFRVDSPSYDHMAMHPYGSFPISSFWNLTAYNLGIGEKRDFFFISKEANPALFKKGKYRRFYYIYSYKDIKINIQLSNYGDKDEEIDITTSFQYSRFSKPGENLQKLYFHLKEMCSERDIGVKLVKKHGLWRFSYDIKFEIV